MPCRLYLTTLLFSMLFGSVLCSSAVLISLSEELKDCQAFDFEEFFVYLCKNRIFFYSPEIVINANEAKLKLIYKMDGQFTTIAMANLFFRLESTDNTSSVAQFRDIHSTRPKAVPHDKEAVTNNSLVSKIFGDSDYFLFIYLKEILENDDSKTVSLSEDSNSKKISLGIHKYYGLESDYIMLLELKSLVFVADYDVYKDPNFGKSYLFVGLSNGTVNIYRFFFQDSEVSPIMTLNIDELSCISQISHHSDFLFISCNNSAYINSDSPFNFLQVLRIYPTWEDFNLKKQCTLSLDQESETTLQNNTSKVNGRDIDIQIKGSENSLLILASIKGVKLLVFTLELPSFSNPNSITCPSQARDVIYAQDLGSETLVESFMYLTSPKSIPMDVSNQGILLSLVNTSKLSFMPYCLPNYYLSGSQCRICNSGTYSYGGIVTQCKSCSQQEDKGLNFSEESESCHFKCKDPLTFGSKCINCTEYRAQNNAYLPSFSSWNDESESCTFTCNKANETQFNSLCVSTYEKVVTEDHCRQINDCYNCSMSTSCNWYKNNCVQSVNSPRAKTSHNDSSSVFVKLLKCETPLEVCGNYSHYHSNGTVTFLSDRVDKNTFCRWNLAGEKNLQTQLFKLDVAFGSEISEDLSHSIHIYIFYCHWSFFGRRICLFEQFSSSKHYNMTAVGLEIVVLAQKQLSQGTQSLRIIYERKSIPASKILRIFLGCLILFLVGNYVCKSRTRVIGHSFRRRTIRDVHTLPSELEMQSQNLEESDLHEHAYAENARPPRRVISRDLFDLVNYDVNNPNEYEQTDCCFCLESFKDHEKIARVVCKHIFHTNCLESWVSVNETEGVKCPICTRILL